MGRRHRLGIVQTNRPKIRITRGFGGDVVPREPSFNLPFSDLGSGLVATTPIFAVGSGTPTFTRATVAWTKLASGLWTQVASGSARSTYLGFNTAVGAYGGYYTEQAGTQLVTPAASIRDMTDAAWTKGATITATKTATGIDGAVNSCTTLTGGAVSATNTAFQTLVAAASNRTYSCWIKRRTGTGTINITQNGGSTYTDITSQINASTFTRVSLTASVLNATFGIQIVTNTDAIDVDFNQFETGLFATSPMATAGVARHQDVLYYSAAGNVAATSGTEYAEVTRPLATGDGVVISHNITITPMYFRPSGQKFMIYDGTTEFAYSSAVAAVIESVVKTANFWSAASNTMGGSTNGGAVTTTTFDGLMVVSGTLNIGTNDNISQSPWNGTIKNLRLWTTNLTASQLVTLTANG